MRKLGSLTVFVAANLLLAAADVKAGFKDDICRNEAKEIVACCPQCSVFCGCTL